VAKHRHKREANARLYARLNFKPKAAFVAAPIAALITTPAVAFGVFSAELPGLSASTPSSLQAAGVASDIALPDRGEIVSRSSAGGRASAPKLTAKQRKAIAERKHFAKLKKASAKAVANADERLWTTTEVNLWTGPGDLAVQDGTMEAGKHVLVTGRRDQGRVEIVVGKLARWISVGYLSADKPDPEPEEMGIGGACTNGTSAPGGANVVKVHQAVCANFPSITTYGVWRAGATDHSSGRAVDIMVSGALGWDIANFVRANAGALGVSYVIYAQHIWSVERSGEGWRGMSNRGSVTANHFDHVHVSTY
jgi:hypothetical protein